MSLTMSKVILVLSFFCQFGCLLSVTVDPQAKNLIVPSHSAGGIFNIGGERQVLSLAPFSGQTAAVAAPVSPLAFAGAPVGTPLALMTPAAALVPAPSLPIAAPAALVPAPSLPVAAPAAAPVLAKIAQFKLSYPQYAYGYSVQDFTTGDNKVAKEVREGEIVKGSYSVADPDGTKRTVNYYADPVHGFNAVVHKTQILK